MRNLVFRADSGAGIGSGHIMRSLPLAFLARQQGTTVTYLCRKRENDLRNYLVQKHKFNVVELEARDEKEDARATSRFLEIIGPSFLIVDHYELGRFWHKQTRFRTQGLMVIEDKYDREIDADIVLNQYWIQDSNPYENLAPPECVSLLGPRYAQLRSEFLTARETQPSHDGSIKNLLVFFGAADTKCDTEKVLRSLASLDLKDRRFTVLVGPSNPRRDLISKLTANLPGATTIGPTDDMAKLIAASDMVLGAAGTTVYETCCLGKPSVLVITAEPQKIIEESVRQMQYASIIGRSEEIGSETWLEFLSTKLGDREYWRRQASIARKVVDGVGAQRALEKIRTFKREVKK